MPTTADMTAALEEYRQILQADGADLQLDEIAGGAVKVRLLFGPETCQDCIMDRATLEQIMLNGLRERDGEVTAVVLEDPRES